MKIRIDKYKYTYKQIQKQLKTNTKEEGGVSPLSGRQYFFITAPIWIAPIQFFRNGGAVTRTAESGQGDQSGERNT